MSTQQEVDALYLIFMFLSWAASGANKWLIRTLSLQLLLVLAWSFRCSSMFL